MKKYLILSAAVLAFAACQNNDDAVIESNDLVPLQVSVANLDVTQSVETRAYSTGTTSFWEAGDAIGLYAYNIQDTETAIAASPYNGVNAKYTASGADASSHVSGSSPSFTYTYKAFSSTAPVYLPANGDKIKIYAYYPHSEASTITATSVNSVDIALGTQTVQKNLDFMTASAQVTEVGGSTDITKANHSCQLLFAHKLVKLQFNLSAGTGMAASDITSATVTVGNLPTAVNYDVKADAVKSVTNATSTITAYHNTGRTNLASAVSDANKQVYEVITAPNGSFNTAANHLVTITIGTATYTFTINASGTEPVVASFVGGNAYVFNVQVNAASLDVTAAITPWNVTVKDGIVAQ